MAHSNQCQVMHLIGQTGTGQYFACICQVWRVICRRGALKRWHLHTASQCLRSILPKSRQGAHAVLHSQPCSYRFRTYTILLRQQDRLQRGNKPARGFSPFCPAFSQNKRMALTPAVALSAPGVLALPFLFSFAALLTLGCSLLTSCIQGKPLLVGVIPVKYVGLQLTLPPMRRSGHNCHFTKHFRIRG